LYWAETAVSQKAYKLAKNHDRHFAYLIDVAQEAARKNEDLGAACTNSKGESLFVTTRRTSTRTGAHFFARFLHPQVADSPVE
jgi:hypothetical protein